MGRSYERQEEECTAYVVIERLERVCGMALIGCQRSQVLGEERPSKVSRRGVLVMQRVIAFARRDYLSVLRECVVRWNRVIVVSGLH